MRFGWPSVRRSSSPEISWATVALLGVALEYWALQDRSREATLSELLRRIYRVEKLAGKAIFCLSFGAFASWFVPHIISFKENHDQP